MIIECGGSHTTLPHLLYSSISLILSVTLFFEHALNTIDGVIKHIINITIVKNISGTAGNVNTA